MDILNKIKEMQQERDWNDVKLADATGLAKSTITSLYQRNNVPTIPTPQSICDAFGITMAQFFSDSNLPLDLTQEQLAELIDISTMYLKHLEVERRTPSVEILYNLARQLNMSVDEIFSQAIHRHWKYVLKLNVN